MALQSGYSNNINTLAIRCSARTQVYTDRSIDIDSDGDEEAVTSVGTPTGTGSVHTFVTTVPAGAARTIVEGSEAESSNLPDGDAYYTLSEN